MCTLHTKYDVLLQLFSPVFYFSSSSSLFLRGYGRYLFIYGLFFHLNHQTENHKEEYIAKHAQDMQFIFVNILYVIWISICFNKYREHAAVLILLLFGFYL